MTRPRPRPLPNSAGETASPTLLLVEDEVMLRSLVAEFLRLEGFRVLEAGDVAEAKRLLSAHRHVQLVLTDIHMPGVENGTDLARYVQESYPRIPILVVSGHFGQINLGNLPFLNKPFELEKLLSVIQALLFERREFDLNGK